MVPYAEAGPLYGLVLPILISVVVTPTTVWAVTPLGPASDATPSATQSATSRLVRLMEILPSGWIWPAPSRDVPLNLLIHNRRPRPSDPEEPQGAGDPARHHVHEHDEEDPEDGPGGRLGDVQGPVWHEENENGAEDGPRDGGEPADDDARQERHGEEHVEGIGGDEGDGDGAEGSRDPRVGRAHAEDHGLVQRAVDPHRLRGEVIVSDGHDGAAGAPPEEVRREHEQDDEDDQAEEVEPLILAEGQAPGRLGLGEHDALRSARPVLEVLEDLRQSEGQGEGGEGEVETFEAEGGPAEEKADHEAEDARDGNGPPVTDVPPVDHDGRGVGADGVERAVPERELAVVTGEDVEAEQRDGIDADLRALEDPEAAQHEGERAGRDQHHHEAGALEPVTRLRH